MSNGRLGIRILGAGVVALGISVAVTRATPSSGTSSMLVGRATIQDAFKVKRASEEHDWKVMVQAKPALDIAVQTITFQPGGQSGWHTHPGPVFISVVEGTMTFYESDDPTCSPTIRQKGEAFLDTGDHAHIARNESGAIATNVVTYFAPPGAALRNDAPDPGNCPF